MDSDNYTQKKYCFSKLVEQSPIRVPRIQRDYAQGRKNEAVNEIRDRFVHNLISAISYDTPLELDFIYGSDRDNAFEPLDGQQRLTTMFLLHWMLGYNLYDSLGDKSLLTYDTRDTSTDFCLELVQHSSEQFRKEADTKNAVRADRIKACTEAIEALEKEEEKGSDAYIAALKKAREDLAAAKEVKKTSVSEIIRNRDWFNYLWGFDPTILSMLVMIDAIWEEMDWSLDLSKCLSNLDKITFSYLNLGDFGLSDELFIKMNARGKQLSSFDFVKSTLEEEIQVQKTESHCNTNTEEQWRSSIDGKWIDWFWKMFASEHINEITEDPKEYKERLGYAKKAEDKLKGLILRMICLQLFRNTAVSDSVRSVAYNDSESDLDKIIPKYQDSLKKARKGGASAPKDNEIDFDALIDVINSLFYRSEDKVYHSVFDLIPTAYNINCNVPDLSCLDIALGENFPNDCKVIFYAIQRYLAITPIRITNSKGETDKEGEPDDTWKSDFIYWAHACRNIFINDNNNTRIDTPAKFMTALEGVDKLIEDLKAFRQSLLPMTVREFFASLAGKTYSGVDNQSLKEEVDKAVLSADPAWEERIGQAESQKYLWGQIRFLIDWSEGDATKFDNYNKKLSELLSYDSKYKLRAALLCISPDYGFSGSRLYQFNKDRDNSVKRYFRDEASKGSSGVYGRAFKAMIDKWTDEYGTLPFADFVDSIIKEGLKQDNCYARCIISEPSILEEAWNLMLFQHNGHYILAQRKTINSHCFDIALLFLWRRLNHHPDVKDFIHYDSVGTAHQYAVSYSDKNGDKILVQQAPEGRYELYTNLNLTKTFDNEKALLDHFQTEYSIS